LKLDTCRLQRAVTLSC